VYRHANTSLNKKRESHCAGDHPFYSILYFEPVGLLNPIKLVYDQCHPDGQLSS